MIIFLSKKSLEKYIEKTVQSLVEDRVLAASDELNKLNKAKLDNLIEGFYEKANKMSIDLHRQINNDLRIDGIVKKINDMQLKVKS